MYGAGEIFYNAGDYAMARGWYEKAAAQGDTNAMTALGKMYQDGRGVLRDYAKEREWYEKAGDAKALKQLPSR
jgi:uncharacterized protein